LGAPVSEKKMFSLQSETKRNEIRFACVSHAHAEFFSSLLFASNFSLLIKAKLIERIFASFCFQKLFVSLLFCFVFASVHFRFASDAKTSGKKFFRIEAKKFCFRFASFRFKAKMMAVFRFRFASFRFEAKMMAVFRFFFVLISLRFIFVSLHISVFCIEAKKISLQSENDGAP
jgi:hypothetical protein